MNPLTGFLGRARGYLLRERAQRWSVRGVAAGALAAFAFELLMRVRPVDPWWPGLAACAVLGAALAIGAVWFWRNDTSGQDESSLMR